MPKKGYKQTEEHRKKMIEAKKGYKHPEETKQKIAKAHKGKKRPPFSEEWRQNIGNAHRGMKRSEETKRKMSEAHKGQMGWWKGKKFSPETRRKISETRRGMKLSDEAKLKMSKAHKGKRFGANNSNWKGGITPLFAKIKNSPEYAIWRNKVFERDNYTCQGQNHPENIPTRSGEGKKIIFNSHHKKPFSKIIIENKIFTMEEAISCKELWNIDNGITLCEKCHEQTDSYKGKGHD